MMRRSAVLPQSFVVPCRELRRASDVFEAIKRSTATRHPGITRSGQFTVELFRHAPEHVSLSRVVGSVTGSFNASPANPGMNRRN